MLPRIVWNITCLKLCLKKLLLKSFCQMKGFLTFLLNIFHFFLSFQIRLDERIQKERPAFCSWCHFVWEVIEDSEKWRGVSRLMHLCSPTDDTPPDLSVHLPPQSRFTALFSNALLARGALFSSVLNELNGRSAKKARLIQHTRNSSMSEGRGVPGQKFRPCSHAASSWLQMMDFSFI